jgi:hypothetical protein
MSLLLIAYPRLENIDVLRKVFKAIVDAEKYKFNAVSNEFSLMGHPISSDTLSKFYNDKTNLTEDNKKAVREWVEKYLGEKKNKEKITLVGLGLTIST